MALSFNDIHFLVYYIKHNHKKGTSSEKKQKLSSCCKRRFLYKYFLLPRIFCNIKKNGFNWRILLFKFCFCTYSGPTTSVHKKEKYVWAFAKIICHTNCISLINVSQETLKALLRPVLDKQGFCSQWVTDDFYCQKVT